MKLRLLYLFALALSVFSATPATAQTFTDVAIGSTHICAITDNAEVDCTTTPFSERYDAPEGLPSMMAIAAGDQHTCGIDLEGRAVCWGAMENNPDGSQNNGSFDQLNVPAITQPLVSIGAGANHTCAIDVDSRVWCWGLDSNQQSQPPGDGLGANGAGFTKVDGGINFTCGIQTNGDIACWTNDSRFDVIKNITGPFTDLDVDYFNACGLRADGSIDCWLNRFAPPGNGPYTDLVVSRSAICGLNQNQTVDCTFASNFSPELPVFPADARFTEIESGSQVFSAALPFCGLTVSGSIQCSSSNQFDSLSPPGADDKSEDRVKSVSFVLDARRYSPNQLEIFWNGAPQRFGREKLSIEIYRNDILVDTTDNNASWYDPSEQAQNPVTYKIRAIDAQGNVGPFSSSVSIDMVTGDITYEDSGTTFDIVQPVHTVDNLSVRVLSNSHVVVWSGSVPGENGLKGYEVRVNNKPVVFTSGFIHRLETFNSRDCNKVSVAAMSEEGTIFDYRVVVTNRFSRNYSSCSNND